MTPLTHVAKEANEIFNISVNISNVVNLRSVKFAVTYNVSLLSIAQVVQGTFFPSSPKSYFEFNENKSIGFIEVNITLAKSENPINGSGTLAWIIFRSLQGPEFCVGSPIGLQQTLLLDSVLTPIVHDSVGAVYFWSSMIPDPPIGYRLLDLYTHKNGKGLNKPGGRFMPDEMVYLISEVTYNSDPVANKLVSFEVRNPYNESVWITTEITNQDGLAITSFRIPNDITNIGVWTVISIVEIAGETVWDILTFRVYLPTPVGGYTYQIETYTSEKPLTFYIAALLILTTIFTITNRKTNKKLKQPNSEP